MRKRRKARASNLRKDTHGGGQLRGRRRGLEAQDHKRPEKRSRAGVCRVPVANGGAPNGGDGSLGTLLERTFMTDDG